MAAKGTKKELPKADMDWFTNDRLGLFIHWGLYALPARHEWVKSHEHINEKEYRKYFDHFDPDLYDPKQWAKAAAGAGMKYFCVTTKHHDGFCLWDTKQTDYNVTNTPYGKDLIKPMVEAFRGEGMRVGFYHSLIDWHHPEYPVDCFHPMRDDEKFKKKNLARDVSKYAKYLHAQTRELFTKFGRVDYVFYDFSFPHEGGGKGRNDWQSEELMKLTRQLQPGIIINDRLDLEDMKGGWDVKTPEQVMVDECVKVNGKPVKWETCQTFSGSWGYHRDESSWKSTKQLLYLLIDTVSKDGNLLLNVGPTGRGEFDERALTCLSGMGEWMRRHDRSIYGCGSAPKGVKTPRDCRLTYNAKTRRLYVHFMNWPIGAVQLPGLAGRIKYAQLLNDASEVFCSQDGKKAGGDVILRLPTLKPAATVPVVELFLKR
jgi:alpha-L-fucosidase